MKRLASAPLRLRSRAGVTMIEMLVAMGVASVVAGLFYGVYDATYSATGKVMARQTATAHSMIFMDEVLKLLEEAVPPEDLDASVGASASFSTNSFTVPVFLDSPAKGLYLATVRPGAELGDAYQRVNVQLGGSAESPAAPESARNIGAGVEEFSPQLILKYATSVKPGEEPTFVDELPEGEWPALVQILVRCGEVKGYPTQPVLLRTSIAPGRTRVASSAEPVEAPEAIDAPDAPTPEQGGAL